MRLAKCSTYFYGDFRRSFCLSVHVRIPVLFHFCIFKLLPLAFFRFVLGKPGEDIQACNGMADWLAVLSRLRLIRQGLTGFVLAKTISRSAQTAEQSSTVRRCTSWFSFGCSRFMYHVQCAVCCARSHFNAPVDLVPVFWIISII